MPCMKSISALVSSLAGTRMVLAERILLLCPGAPGCTMVGCWQNAAAALREIRDAETRQTRSAMSHYKPWFSSGSNVGPPVVAGTAGPTILIRDEVDLDDTIRADAAGNPVHGDGDDVIARAVLAAHQEIDLPDAGEETAARVLDLVIGHQAAP